MKKVKKKVVIIGTGPAGLTAAYSLLKNSKEYEVIVLEELNQVGGISKTINYHGNRMDLGGHRFFTKDDDVLALWKSILNDKEFTYRRRVSRIYYNKRFFDYPVNLSFKTIKNLGFKDTIIAGFSYLKSLVHKLPEDNLENFYINRFGKKLYSIFFKDYTEKLWGIEPSKLDSSWGSQRVKGVSIKEVLKDYFCRLFKMKNKNKQTSLIDSFLYPKYGPGMVYEKMAKIIEKMGGVIKLNARVVKITKENNVIKGITYRENGTNIPLACDYLISSMPIKDLVNGMNNVPKKVKNVASNLVYRDFITIGVILDKLKIKNNTKLETVNNIIPDTWIYVQSNKQKLGRIQVFNNWSPDLLKDINTISLGLEYFCTEGDNLWNSNDNNLKELAINELTEMGIISSDTKVLDYHVERVKKAYPAYFGVYKDFDLVKDYLNSINNLFCIGRNGMHRYNNMDHSMKSAMVCVNNIINNISDKENIWSVNTDESYHEIKEEEKRQDNSK